LLYLFQFACKGTKNPVKFSMAFPCAVRKQKEKRQGVFRRTFLQIVGFPCAKPMFPRAEPYIPQPENLRFRTGKHRKCGEKRKNVRKSSGK